VRTTPVADARHQRLNPEFSRFDADVARYNQMADKVVARVGIPAIDLYGFTRRLGKIDQDLEALYEDHVHFTEPVQRLQAAYIAGWLHASPEA
jgi:hypothetical protein